MFTRVLFSVPVRGKFFQSGLPKQFSPKQVKCLTYLKPINSNPLSTTSTGFLTLTSKNFFPLTSFQPAFTSKNSNSGAIRNFISSPVYKAPRSIFKPSSSPRIIKDEDSELVNLTPPIRAHLRNVYSSLATVTMVAGGASIFGMMNALSVSPGLGLVGGLGLILGIMFTPRHYNAARLGMLYGFAGLEGLTIAPLIAHVAVFSPVALPAALIGTGSIFLGFTALSLVAKSRSMLTIGGPLFGSLLAVIGLQIAAYFIPSLAGIAHSVSLYGGLAIFSGYIAYDTQRMIENARYGETDVVSDTLSMFLNIFNVFTRLLMIFRRDE